MSNYSIGLSGLDAVQKALDVIGNNIANAATDGYHRQRVNLAPLYSVNSGKIQIGGGVDVTSITRVVDNFLEEEILRQNSLLELVSQESNTLYTIENAFGEFSIEDSGFNHAIDRFFNSLQDLSSYPADAVWQNQVISDAEAMANQFRAVGEFLSTLATDLRLEVENTVESINALITQIADLNYDIERLEIGGGQANNLRDQRDSYISELSELINVQTVKREFGVVDVVIAGMSVVMGSSASTLETGFDESGNLGISMAGEYSYKTNIEGGKIGGLLSLKNTILSDIHSDLDTLASTLIQQINQYHVQGVGSAGSFASLTGWEMTSENLSAISTVTDGSIYIRLTNTSTGAITRNKIDIDASADTLSSVATSISAITGLSASVSSSNQLTISAEANYKFDFLPAVLSGPTSSDLTGTTAPPTMSVSGIYTGTNNDVFTFTVVGSDDVGNGTMQLKVTNVALDTVDIINIGSGYAAGDEIDVGSSGIKIALTTGDLVVGNTFTVDVFGDTDTSGMLSAVGINTFFSGSTAKTIAVDSNISASPKRIATSLGPDMTDNTNVSRMAVMKDETMSSLNSLTFGGFYRQMVNDIGQQLTVKQMRQDNLEGIIQNLVNRQSDVSGVDLNEEAAQMLIFEQLFQAMAKYINAVHSSLASLMELI